MAAPKIPLNQILAAMDRKDRDFYDNLDEQLKKSFSPFLMLKYSAAVTGSPDLEDYYIASTNKHANKNMFADVFAKRKHIKLQWLMLTTVSPGYGKQNHKWIGAKPAPADPNRKQLAEIYPNMKDDELDLLSKITTKKELKQYVKDCGS